MSLNKELCEISPTELRQSFSGRICDDLCEVILQYLSLEDKLRLECVSKQFQRTVFHKLYSLAMVVKKPRGWAEDSEELLIRNNSLNLKSFESLLKKCPNITSIKFWNFNENFNDYNEFIALVIKYCNNLIEFNCTLTQLPFYQMMFVSSWSESWSESNGPLTRMNETTFNDFQTKFGLKLKSFGCIYSKKELDRLKYLPNLEGLQVIVPTKMPDNIQVKFNKLKKLKIYHCKQEDVILKNLVDNFTTVRYLELSLDLNVQGLNYISNLKELVHLKVLYLAINENLYFEAFKQMADNCPKLKSIEFCFKKLLRDNSELPLLLSHLKILKQLRRMRINVYNRTVANIIMFEAFKVLSNITHLSLSFISKDSVDEKLIKDIDIYLPNLQYLYISLTFDITPEGTTQLTNILSRLSMLYSIKLKVTTDLIRDQLIEELSDKCKNIRKIEVIL